MMRQGSCWLLLGLGLKACTMSGNFMPSRTKKTCGKHTTPKHRQVVNKVDQTRVTGPKAAEPHSSNEHHSAFKAEPNARKHIHCREVGALNAELLRPSLVFVLQTSIAIKK